jgi:exosome complex RNA-binding protein Csl4
MNDINIDAWDDVTEGGQMENKRFLSSLVSMVLAISLVLSITMDSTGQASGPSSTAADIVHGDVLNIEGDTYTIKDVTGHEVHLRIDAQTHQEDRIKVGDKVEAQVSSDGRAQTIRIALPSDTPRQSQ